jgi:hypothetical protein
LLGRVFVCGNLLLADVVMTFWPVGGSAGSVVVGADPGMDGE